MIGQASSAFQRCQELAVATQLCLAIRPGRVAALSGNPWCVVEDPVEDGRADMAHAYFIDIGEGQGEGHIDFGPVFTDAAAFATQITGWAFQIVK